MLGLPALLLHMVCPALAAAPAFAARLLLRLLALLCETVADVPFAQVDAASPPVFVLVCFVGLLFLCSPYFMEFAKRRRIALAAGILCATALSLLLWLPGELDRRQTPTVTFFSVGTADSALLRSENAALLVDTGWTGSAAVSYMQGEGRSLNAVLLTHADGDHAGGLEHLLQTVPVGAVMVPRGMSWEGLEPALAAAQEKNIPILELTAGDAFTADAFTVTVLSPTAVREGQENDDSLVLRVDCAGRTLLFTGDISARTEAALALPDCDVLKVPHHGSATATSDALLAQTTPELAVLSVGTPNRYGFPRPEVLDRLAASGAQISACSLPNEFKGLPTTVTVRDVVSTYIYTNTLVVLALDRAALRQYMERSAMYFAIGSDGQLCIANEFLAPKVEHYNYDYFSGVDYVIDVRRPAGERVTSIRLNGRELGEDETVTVCINSYRSCGTGGYGFLVGQKVVADIQVDVADAMIEYIMTHPQIRVDTHRYCEVRA